MVSRETGFTLQSFLLFIDINSYNALKKYISLGRLVMSRKAEKKPLKFHGYFFSNWQYFENTKHWKDLRAPIIVNQ